MSLKAKQFVAFGAAFAALSPEARAQVITKFGCAEITAVDTKAPVAEQVNTYVANLFRLFGEAGNMGYGREIASEIARAQVKQMVAAMPVSTKAPKAAPKEVPASTKKGQAAPKGNGKVTNGKAASKPAQAIQPAPEVTLTVIEEVVEPPATEAA